MTPEQDAEWRRDLDSWDLTEDEVRAIADTFLDQTEGDARKLFADWKAEDGIYGKCAEAVTGQNSAFHRWVLFGIWVDNKFDTRAHFRALKFPGRENTPIKPFKISETAEKKICWCRTSVLRRLDAPSIQCDYCNQWWHQVCVGLTGNQAEEVEEFKCPSCKGSPRPPPIFRSSALVGPHHSEIVPPVAGPGNQSEMQTPVRRDINQQGEELQRQSGADESTERTSPGRSPLGRGRGRLLFQDEHVSEPSSSLETENRPGDQNPSATPEPQENPEHSASPNPSRGSSGRGRGKKRNQNEQVPEPGPQQEPRTRPRQDSSSSAGTTNDVVSSNEDINRAVADQPRIHRKKKEVINWNDAGNFAVPRPPGTLTSFTFTITRQEYEKFVLETYDATGKLKAVKLTSEHRGILYPKFALQNSYCPIQFLRKTCVPPWKSRGKAEFFQVWTECGNSTCSAGYKFSIAEVPDKQQRNVTVQVKLNKGEAKHLEGSKAGRYLAEERRQGAQDQLQVVNPSHFRMQQATDPLGAAAHAIGNTTFVRPLFVYQKARAERLKAQDLDKEPIMDICKTAELQREQLTATETPGYIQEICTEPARIVMVTERQYQYLFEKTKNEDVVLYLDSTGSTVKEFPPPFVAKEPYYYALVVDTEPGEAALPVAEFYLGDHSMQNITLALHSWRLGYSNYCYKKKRDRLGIARIETDFSTALISSVCDSFNGCTTEQYINAVFDIMTEKQPEIRIKVASHVCNVHVDRAFLRKICQYFKLPVRVQQATAEASRIVDFWMDWVQVFMRVTSLPGAYRRMEEALMFASMEYLTPDLADRILKVHDDFEYEDRPWDSVPFATDRKLPFHKRSKFGNIGNRLAETIATANLQIAQRVLNGESFPKNPFYNLKLKNYLVVYFFPYTPLLTHSGLVSLRQTVTQTTTNKVEYWFKVFKVDCLRRQKKLTLARALRIHFEVILGKLNLLCPPTRSQEIPETEDFVELDDQDYLRYIADEDVQEDSHETPEKSSEKWGSKQDLDKDKRPSVRRSLSEAAAMPVMKWQFKENIPHLSMDVEGLNTCPTDAPLQCLLHFRYFHRKGPQYFRSKMHLEVTKQLEEILGHIMKGEHGVARVKYRQNFGMLPITPICDFYGNELEMGLDKISPLAARYTGKIECQNPQCGKTSMVEFGLPFSTVDCRNLTQYIDFMNNGMPASCEYCCKDALRHLDFEDEPDEVQFLIIPTTSFHGTENHGLQEQLPREFQVRGFNFEVLSYTVLTRQNHYYATAFDETSRRWNLDGQKYSEPFLLTDVVADDNVGVSTIFAFRKE